ncbi:MAG: hypothetical protein PGN23_09115 [Sphingomonas adhaesiva]|uniref:hypothetical protein n=1 Tax=Sphingomonas adhaesiva TaxID=28212 RepID=UPI002FF6C31F
MTFTQFGWPAALAGAVALAGLLYWLQRLRARRRVVALPTAMLWMQAARAAPVRVLGGRFRYWLAYLLTLAIALLLWFAAAHPQVAATEGGFRRFYLDSSAVLSGGDDLARAKRALLADVRATPAARREVFSAEGRLLAPGESASLLSGRLDRVTAAARPSTFADWQARHRDGIETRYYGAWAAARDVPGRTALSYGYLADPVPGNRGIVALGVSPAASGAWRDADVLVTLAAAGAARATAADLRWTLDGAAFAPGEVTALGGGRYVLRDVAATGAVLRATLDSGDGFPADDVAAVRLPDRRPLRVALLAGTPGAVRAAVQANDSFAVVPVTRAQVVVGNAQAVGGSERPALILTPAGADATFVFAGPGEAENGDLADRLDELGLAQVDAGALATALDRPIGVDVRDAPRRSIAVWGALFDPAAPFARGAAMPAFVAQGLHWLGRSDGWRPYAKAGAPLPDQSALYGLAGAPRTDDTPTSLIDRATTRAVADAGAQPAVTGVAGRLPPDLPFLLLLVAAGLLLGAEWWLFHGGRMP